MPSQLLASLRVAVLAWLIGSSTARPQFERYHDGTPSPYSLVEHYKPKHFFEKFIFFTEPDPTGGFVQYVNQSYARQNGLIRTFDDHVTIGVDNVNYYDPRGAGRPSVRIQSHKTYTHGLFILDLNRMPHACGAWPAFWTFGPDWPLNGEIDIIEGVNTNDYNLVSLHTNPGCSTAGDHQWGQLVTANCALGDSHQGCGVLAHGKHNATFGHGFNRRKGGVYAMEWTSNYIRTWHFGRHMIPKSIQEGTPDTSEFGVPMANFQGSCDMDKHFKDHTITFDVTFCGNYAGASYSESNCPNAIGGYRSCMDFVGNNPKAFRNVEWSINDLKVYQLKGSETSYLTAGPTVFSSVAPLYSSYDPHHPSSYQIPGGGHRHTKHVPTHSLSVASTHKSNRPPKTTPSSHKTSETHHSTSFHRSSSSGTSSKTSIHSGTSAKSTGTYHSRSSATATHTPSSHFSATHHKSSTFGGEPTTSQSSKVSGTFDGPMKPTQHKSTLESQTYHHKSTLETHKKSTKKYPSTSEPTKTRPTDTTEPSSSYSVTAFSSSNSEPGLVPTSSILSKHRGQQDKYPAAEDTFKHKLALECKHKYKHDSNHKSGHDAEREFEKHCEHELENHAKHEHELEDELDAVNKHEHD